MPISLSGMQEMNNYHDKIIRLLSMKEMVCSYCENGVPDKMRLENLLRISSQKDKLK